MTEPTRPQGIRTLAQLQQSNRHLDQVRREVSRTVTAMRRGAVLNLEYRNGRSLWRLSSGPFITREIAAIVTASTSVVAAGDGLFPDHPGQTWRYVNG
jgi:hypothetical protein